ncbi:MAG: DMT family transporter [Rhodospirillales bacterium]|nr:DMT family transporter [Rhodospirillales bacterium]
MNKGELSAVGAAQFQAARRNRLIGISLMCGAVFCFACLDVTAKYLSAHMNIVEIVWARYTGAFALALLVSNPFRRPALMKTKRPVVQISRSILLLISTALNFISFQYLQLDQALAIMFSTPFIVAAVSGPVLGEWIGYRRWIAIAVGFLGVLIVTRPGLGAIHPAALASVASAFVYGAYLIATRLLARSDSDETTLFYSNVVGAIALIPVVPFIWVAPSSTLILVLMVLLGLAGGFGHYLLILAHRKVPASVLSPFMYTQLVWAVAFGYMVFADVPDRWTLAGSGVVVLSGLYLLHRERVARTEHSL